MPTGGRPKTTIITPFATGGTGRVEAAARSISKPLWNCSADVFNHWGKFEADECKCVFVIATGKWRGKERYFH